MEHGMNFTTQFIFIQYNFIKINDYLFKQYRVCLDFQFNIRILELKIQRNKVINPK